jgi:hypothetical protein
LDIGIGRRENRHIFTHPRYSPLLPISRRIIAAHQGKPAFPVIWDGKKLSKAHPLICEARLIGVNVHREVIHCRSTRISETPAATPEHGPAVGHSKLHRAPNAA